MRHVVVDTETTGMTPPEDAVVELAAVWPGGSYSTLVDPGRDIPPAAKAVHHITEEMVAGAPRIHAALDELLQRAGPERDIVWVAHNVPFDSQFLDPPLMSLGARPVWICTYRCALHLIPGAPGHSNQVLRYHLGLKPEVPADLYPHRALYDAIVTQALLQHLLTLADTDRLIELTMQPVLLEICSLKKYRGRKWSEVPADYLQWVVRQEDMSADIRHTAAHWLRPPQGRLI